MRGVHVQLLAQELRHAARGWLRRPGLLVPAVIALALGIGANTAVFSVVNAILLRRLPFAEPAQLVALWPDHFFANREIEFLRRELRSTAQVASVSPGWLSALTGVADPTEVDAARVSGNLFNTLGVRALIGITFGMEAEDPGAATVAVLGYEMWQSKFGGDPAIIGQTIILDRVAFRVLGVMPRTFKILDQETDLYLPLAMDPNAMSYAGGITLGVARLRAGVSTEAASAEFQALAVRMGRQFQEPAEFARSAQVANLQEQVVGPMRATLAILFAAVFFILLIAVANVANLQLVRATERRTEIAVRTALGASRGALLRQLGAESLLLALAGGGLGVLSAFAIVPVLRSSLPAATPRLQEISLSGGVLVFAVALSVLVAFGIGVVPALLAARRSAISAIRGGRTTTGATGRLRGVLILVEVALAVVLLSGATLMLRTLQQLNNVDPGFRREHVLTFRAQPSQFDSVPQLRTYWRTLLPRLEALPGVVAAGTVLHLPLGGRRWNANIVIEGLTLPEGATPPRAAWQAINGHYFDAFGIRLLRGRGFTPTDREDVPRVVIINDVMARKLWPNGDPLNARIRAGNATQNDWATIVGVVSSVRHDSLTIEPGPELYVPFDQRPVVATSVVVRTNGDPAELAAAARAAVWSQGKEVPISHMRTIADVLAQSTQRQRVTMTLLVAIAGLGLILGVVGVAGLVSYAVRQRRREVAIRLALGARARDVTALLASSGFVWAAGGVVVGSALSWILTRFMRGLLFGVSPLDPVTLAAVPAILLLVAITSAYVPALRAARTSPAEALQE